MSFDIDMVPPDAWCHECPPGGFTDPCYQCMACVEVGNITYNISPMWTEALGDPVAVIAGREESGIRVFHGAPGLEAAGPLREAVETMRREPERFRAMNPPNGWGNYEGALAFLERLAAACVALPSYRISIS